MRVAIPLSCAVAAALLFTAACPPHQWWLAAWLVPALLLIPLRGRSAVFGACCGMAFGTAWGCTMAAWMRHASLAYFDFDGLMASAFTLGVSVFYAGIPYGILAAVWAPASRRIPPALAPALGAWLWTCSELLRTHVFTGLPWELLGHTQFERLTLIQIADLGGAYAVTFVIAFTSLCAGALLGRPHRLRSLRAVAADLAPAALLLAATLAYGVQCARTYATPPRGDGATVAIVQGNVPNAFRWKREFFERTLLTYTSLSLPAREASPDLIVWPENAVNFYVEHEPALAPALASVAGLARDGFLFGGPRIGADGRSYVSAYLLGRTGDVLATYDKRRLLPFAEYDPLRSLDERTLDGPISFSPGETAAPLQLGALRLGTLICYEVLFPRLVRDLVLRGAEVLVNISNDSWLDDGDGAAPRQHFSMVPFSAVATRRFLVRASASGISGFVSPYGTPYALVGRAQAGTAVGEVFPRRDTTIYVRWGDTWLVLLGLLLAPALRRSARARA